MFRKFIGDRAFYRRLFVLMMPIMIQNGITNFVNMLDNIMIGSVGTAEMTGISITNQLFFVFNLCIFGAVSGAGIFGAQFFGKNDHDGVRHTFRFKIIFCTVITVGSIALFYFGGEWLIKLYMQGDAGVTDPTATLGHARDYMLIMLIGLLPYSLVQCYSSTLREAEDPIPPMVAGITAVSVNLIFNYILIFGKFGVPPLGVVGAAIATVMSRFIELLIVMLNVHLKKKYNYMRGVYRSLYVPRDLMGKLFIKGLPLILNESLWAAGTAVVSQCYSVKGLDAVAANNISQTFWNVFAITYMAVGSAIGIIIGQMLGANRLSEAKDSARKLIAVSFTIAVTVAVIYAVSAEFIPLAFKADPKIQHLATRMMQLTAIAMPFDAITHSSYFTLRSGGKMSVTIIFDCGFMWCGNVLFAFILSRFTSMPILGIFAIIQGISVVKSLIGIVLVKNGFWVRNIINKEA